MALVVPQTRQELRHTIGYRLKAMITSTTTSAGTTSSFVDTELPHVDRWAAGKHFVQTSGDNNGSIRIVDEYIGGATQGRFRTAMGSAVASGVTYDLFDEDVAPARIHDAINEAIRTVTRKGAPSSEDRSLHSSRTQTTYAIPSAIVGIQRIDYRSYYDREDIDNCDAAWSESNDSDVTVSLDDEDYREGSGAMKLVVAGTVSAGDILVSQDVSTLDLSGMTHVEWWAKASTATAAGDLALILSTTADAGTETEKLAFPALTANTWTRCRVALANPQDDTAIISVGVEYDANEAANDIWIDGVEATEENTEDWEPVERRLWRIKQDDREIFFDREAVDTIGHSNLLLTGVKTPTILSSDTDSCDVEPEYILNYATAQLMRSVGDRRGTSRDAAHTEADRLMGMALDWRRKVSAPNGIRWVQA